MHPSRIHIIGVGGSGMSAIARVLLQQGKTISGSDLHENALTRELRTLGAQIYSGHAAAHIAGAEVILATSAVKDDNPEIAAARYAGIPVLRRREALDLVIGDRQTVAIAGTHGKTTTTALLVHLLREAGLDPGYIVGGVLLNTGDNAGAGSGPHFVIEADEYDRMFLGLRPQVAVVTNIEHDHPDIYPTLGDTMQAFEEFTRLVPPGGLLVVCADDARARGLGEARRAAGLPVVFYGLAAGDALPPGEFWSARQVEPDSGGGMCFAVWRGEREAGPARLGVPGRHNVQNALGALAAADHLGVPFARAAKSLASFRGTARRAEIMGQAGGVTVINDYGHHPTEIQVTLAAQREQPGVRALWAVWQPHTYGRMRALAGDFARAFGPADHVLVTEVYSVRESVSPGLDAAGMAALIDHPDARFSGSLETTAALLARLVQRGDRVVLLSAGDAPQIGTRLLELLGGKEGQA